MGVESWFVLAALLAPVGCVIQDVVADAMPVEAVPLVDEKGAAFDDRTIRLMHTTMQTLGRMAIVGGGIAVSVVNIVMFSGAAAPEGHLFCGHGLVYQPGPVREQPRYEIPESGFHGQPRDSGSAIRCCHRPCRLLRARRFTDHRHLSRTAVSDADDLGYPEVAVAKRIEGLLKSPPSAVA